MGYVPRFKNDIFISYRHASNEAHDKWIDTFCKELQARLTDLVGEVTIWRDNSQIRAGDQWRLEIAEAIDTTAVFLAIVSRTYLDSEICRKELDRVLGRCKAATEVIKTRIVPIFKQPLKKDQKLPQELPEIHHHNFYYWLPPGNEFFREYSPGTNEDTSLRFWETLERLAQELMNALEELKGRIHKETIGTIYLATVGPELHDARDNLRFDLQQRGYRIVPDHDYFWSSSDIQEKIIENLDAAVLCIHLIARTASDKEPETPVHALTQLQLATETMKRKGKPLPLIWFKPADTIDASARALVDFIEQDLANEGVEFLEGGLEEFKTHIYAKLPFRPPPRIPTAANREIAMIVEEGDIRATGEISTFLVKELRIDPKRITFIGTIARDPLSLSKILTGCGKCLIYWGGRSEEWVNEILSLDALADFVGEERLCVYTAPTATPEKETFLTTKARMIPGATGINKDELGRFLVQKEAVT